MQTPRPPGIILPVSARRPTAPSSHRRGYRVRVGGCPSPGHRAEALERRVLLEGAAQAWVPERPAAVADDVAVMEWNGQSVRAAAGRWLLGLDRAPAGRDVATDVARLVSSKRRDLRVVQSLDPVGLTLIEAPKDLDYGRLHQSL